MTPQDHPWLSCVRPHAAPRLRMFALPYAGGSAVVFRQWWKAVPSDIEVCPVQPPGRLNRFREAPFTDVTLLARAFVDATEPLLVETPFVLYGHSLGGLQAYAIMRELERRQLPAPRHLILSSRRPPHTPALRPPVSDLPQAPFVAAIEERYGPLDPRLTRDPDSLAQFLVPLRADMKMFETFQLDAPEPVAMPVTALHGRDDVMVPRDLLEGWSLYDPPSLRIETIAGGHFFVQDPRSAFFDLLRQTLEATR